MRYLIFLVFSGVLCFGVLACDSGGDGDGDGDADGDGDSDGDGDADGDGDGDSGQGTAGYAACVGRFVGTCSDSCCASQIDHHPIDPHPEVSCLVVPGSEAGLYRLSFTIAAPGGAGPAIEGVELEFPDTTTELTLATSCMLFGITEAGNAHTTTTCNTQAVRVDNGGGCEVMLHVDDTFAIFGTFLCREIELEGESSYLSTIYAGGLGVGEFRIDDCEFRL